MACSNVPVVWVDAAGAGTELVHVGLAGEDGAARAQLRHARRVRLARPRLPQPPRPACTCIQTVIVVAFRKKKNVDRAPNHPSVTEM